MLAYYGYNFKWGGFWWPLLLCHWNHHTQIVTILLAPTTWYDIEYSNVVTTLEHRPDFELNIDTQYHTPLGELWGIHCDYFVENLLCYNGTTVSMHAACWNKIHQLMPYVHQV